MKKRNLVIVAFMLVAAMTIGVGYANLTTTLALRGTASYDHTEATDEFASNIIFTAADVTQSGSLTEVTDTATISTDGKAVDFSVKTLATTSDKAIFKFTITNQSNVAATVKINANKVDGSTNPSSTEDYYQFSYSGLDANGVVLQPNGTVDVEVTVSLSRQPTSNVAQETWNLQIFATSEVA